MIVLQEALTRDRDIIPWGASRRRDHALATAWRRYPRPGGFFGLGIASNSATSFFASSFPLFLLLPVVGSGGRHHDLAPAADLLGPRGLLPVQPADLSGNQVVVQLADCLRLAWRELSGVE
jgi:hypothetical protein